MRIEWITVLSMIVPTTALAQDVTQRPVRTEKIAGMPVGVGLYKVGPDSTVLVDWRAVEAAAEGPVDQTQTPIAQMMLAIRDRKWKPMSR